MSLTPAQQFQELLKKSVSPLIIIPAYPSRDTLASAYALFFFLKNLGRAAVLVGDNLLRDKEILNFLGEPDHMLGSITGARDFVLAFNTERNKISNVRTETAEHELRIYLTPERGAIDPRDFSFIPAQFKFDLAVVIGSPDKEHLGNVYEDNPDIFYEIPIVNVDRYSENELYGQINLVDITASSNAEILAELLEKTDPQAFDEKVVECLLTGIIAATESFQKKNTTPKALQLASYLMGKGGDQQKIIRSLYRTQPLHLLKLWGRVMAQVKWNENLKLIWANVSLEDLVQSRASSEDLPYVLEKIRTNYSSAALFMLITPTTPAQVRGFVKAASPENMLMFAERFGDGELHGDVYHFNLNARSLEEAEQHIIEKLLVEHAKSA